MQYGREFMREVDRTHAKFDYTPDFWELTARMRIPVVTGSYNSAVYLPNALITLHPDVFHGCWTFTRFHELAHVVLRDSGIEQQLWHEADCIEQFRTWCEAYCDFGAAQFQAPNPLLHATLARHGYSPAAILELARLTGVDLFDAMSRVAHGFLEDDAARTAFLTQGRYLRRAVTTSAWFPFQQGDSIPEPALTLPGAILSVLPERFGRGRVLGVVLG